jgi:hypothetical protein
MQQANRTHDHQLAEHITQRTSDTTATKLVKDAAPKHSWAMAAVGLNGFQSLAMHPSFKKLVS